MIHIEAGGDTELTWKSFAAEEEITVFLILAKFLIKFLI